MEPRTAKAHRPKTDVIPLDHATNLSKIGPKIGGGGSANPGAPQSENWGGELGPHLTRSRLGRGLYFHTKSHLNLSSHLTTTDMGRKLGAVARWRAGAESPSNTMWPGPRPTCTPSFILIHPTVWPQYTNVTDRTDKTDRQTDRTDNGLIAWGEPFYKRSPKSSANSRAIKSAVHECIIYKLYSLFQKF